MIRLTSETLAQWLEQEEEDTQEVVLDLRSELFAAWLKRQVDRATSRRRRGEAAQALGYVWITIIEKFPDGHIKKDQPKKYLIGTIFRATLRSFMAEEHDRTLDNLIKNEKFKENSFDKLTRSSSEADHTQDVVAAGELRGKLDDLVGRLPPHDRELLLGRFGIKGPVQPTRAYVEAWHVSRQTLNKRMNRILANMKGKLKEYE